MPTHTLTYNRTMEVATELTTFFQLLLALSLGSLLGIERSIAGKQAGMRTFALVTIGSCLLILVSESVIARYGATASMDPLRVAAAIVTGIGFLGAGIIIFNQELRGLTTAASLWVSAAIGMAVAYELYSLALFATCLTLFVFVVLWFVEHYIESHFWVPDREPRVRFENLENEQRPQQRSIVP